jgi:DNA-directed RNA polymerase specialized sigma subunit
LFKWLNDYQKLEDEIIYLEHNLYRSKRELKRWRGGDLAKYKLAPDSDGKKVEDQIAAIEYELAHRMNDRYDLKNLINQFKGLEYMIMCRKYVDGKTLDAIAYELGYSSSYIYKKHAEILKRMKLVEQLSLY